VIDERIVADLVPGEVPRRWYEDFERRPPWSREPFVEPFPAAAWASALRSALADRAREDGELGRLLEDTALVGTGIFHVLSRDQGDGDLPEIDGYRFGVVLFDNGPLRPYPLHLPPVAVDGVVFPVVRFRMERVPHDHDHDGRIAAYLNEGSALCGITAGHVVDRFRAGSRVPVGCSHGHPARLVRPGPGYIDAALVELECSRTTMRQRPVRHVGTGEVALLHLQDGDPLPTTVMMGIDSVPRLLSAAVPQNFLTSGHGRPGQSGSLVSTPADELCGIYLGKHNAADERGVWAPYGHALDLRQAATLLGADPDTLGALDG